MAHALPPIELEVGLDKVAYYIDEVVDTVLLTLSDFKPLVAVTKVEYGIEVMRVDAVELFTYEVLMNVLDVSEREIHMLSLTGFLRGLFIGRNIFAGIEYVSEIGTGDIFFLYDVIVIERPLESPDSVFLHIVVQVFEGFLKIIHIEIVRTFTQITEIVDILKTLDVGLYPSGKVGAY